MIFGNANGVAAAKSILTTAFINVTRRPVEKEIAKSIRHAGKSIFREEQAPPAAQESPAASLVYVNVVTYSEADPQKQMRLHDEDRIAQWFVVKLAASDRESAKLCVSDRFRQLCNPGISENRWSSSLYPSFVSFIGDTGVGKSTLVRAMILMGQVDASDLDDSSSDQLPLQEQTEQLRALLQNPVNTYGPVTRTANLNHLTDPTSSGVHLYKDASHFDAHRTPRTARTPRAPSFKSTNTPILFADCEGFGAGLAQTNSERARSTETASDEAVLAAENTNPNLLFIRDISARGYRSHGKAGAELLYARFLYAFSDVIVFVTKEDQRLQEDMQKLLEWAASAVNKSVNHLAQKTLLIVRNMPNRHAPEFYDRKFLKTSILDNLQPLWQGSDALTGFRRRHNEQSRYYQREIHTNSDFFAVFFQEVDVCYIPDKAKAPMEQVYQQYQELRDQIVRASDAGQEIRSKSWSQYNVPTLSHLLMSAFEHFRTSDLPFDFYKAARRDNPNPVSVADHITNFLRHLQLAKIRSATTFNNVVAMCLVSWAFRNFKQAMEPEDIFGKDLESWCKEGIQIYCEKYQNCGYKFEGIFKCITRRPNHAEHCDERGTRCPGSFDPSDYQEEPSRTLTSIRQLFIQNYKELCAHDPNAPGLPSAELFKQRREAILDLEGFAATWKDIQSNKTCFTCLQFVPDHALSCGHGYCTECVKEFGRESQFYEYGVVMDHCILCGVEWREAHSQLIRLKPRCAGIRVLTLDGGGVRGLIELALLERLEARIPLGLSIRDFFDLIIGTSTGGIIALGLAMTKYDATEMKSKFIEVAKSTFEWRREKWLTPLDPLQITSKALILLRIYDSVYRTTPLKKSLIKLFGEHLNLYSSAKEQSQQRATRVAVTSTKYTGMNRCLITNYNRPTFTSGDDFEREDENAKEMKVWEAGLATSAAPFYFHPFVKEETKKDYVDGALHANLPIDYALQEVLNLWPSRVGETYIDALISVGTGVQKKEIEIPKVLEIGGFKEVVGSFFNNINTERLYKTLMNNMTLPEHVRRKIHRLNADLSGTYVGIDDHKKMPDMEQMVADQMARVDGRLSPLAMDIARVADILIASLFFFEPAGSVAADNAFGDSLGGRRLCLQGTIRCRLAKGSQELKRLTNIVQGFWIRETRGSPSTHDQREWTAIPLAPNWGNAVRIRGDWFRVDCTIQASDRTETQLVLAVSLSPPRDEERCYSAEAVPISGFPVSFAELEKRARSLW